MYLQANLLNSTVSIDGIERIVTGIPANNYSWVWYDTAKQRGEYQLANDYTQSGPLNNLPFIQQLARLWEQAAPIHSPLSLETVRANKRVEINNARDNAEIAGFPYLNKTFDSNQRSVSRISTAAFAASVAASQGQPFSIDWTAMDNTIITLTGPQMMGMPGALAQYALTLHNKAKALKTALDAATTIDQINGIQW